MRNLTIAVVLVLILILVFASLKDESTTQTPEGRGGDGVTATGSGVEGEPVEGGDATEIAGEKNNGTATVLGAEDTEIESVDGGDPVVRRIHGLVRTLTGDPVEGAKIRLIIPGVEEDEAPTVISRLAESDDTGVFTLGVTRDEPGEVEVECERFDTETVAWNPNAEIPVGSEETPLLVTLSSETAIGGRITLPEDLETTEFMIVIQKYSGPRAYHEPVVHKFDDESGEYYAATGDGQRRVWAYAKGAFRSAMVTIPLAVGEQRLDVDFTLEPGCEINGQCYDKQTGLPIDASMAYVPVQHLPGTVNFLFRTEIDPGVRNATHSDDTGSFRLHDLPPGDHLLRVLHPDYKPVDTMVKLVTGEPASVEIAMEQGTGFFGQVLDSEGLPPEQAIVLAIAMGPDMENGQQTAGNVDEEGHYVIKNLAPGYYIVVLVDESVQGQPKFTMSQVNPDSDTQVDFIDVAQEATVKGKVTNLEGDPVKGATLLFMTGGDEDFTFKSCVTDEDGNYEIRNLSLGTHQIGIARQPGGTFAVNSFIELEQPKDYPKDLTFYNLVFNGKARDAKSKKPVRGELLLLSATAEEGTPQEFQGRAELEADGSFEIAGLMPGKYYAVLMSQGYQPAMSEPFDVDEKVHRTVTKDFEVILGAGVEFLVVDSNDQPVDAASVFITDAEGELANPGLPPLTASGIYSFSNLIPGTFTARIVPREGEPIIKKFVAKVGETTKIEVVLP